VLLNKHGYGLLPVHDYSDETPKAEKLQVQFKHGETAQAFKKVFDECVRELRSQRGTLEDETKSPKGCLAPQAVMNHWCQSSSPVQVHGPVMYALF